MCRKTISYFSRNVLSNLTSIWFGEKVTDCEKLLFVQGYFQVLFSCIENLLRSLNVRNLVLPAADEAESLWTNKFGFKKITEDEVCPFSLFTFFVSNLFT